MAFWHLKGSTSGSTSYQDEYLNTIKGIWAGTITSPTQINSLAFNQSASSVSGTFPTSGIYTWNTTTTSTTSSTLDDNIFYGIKKHYAKGGTGVDSSYDPGCRVYMNGDTQYGICFNMTNSEGANPGLATQGDRYPSGASGTTATNGWYPRVTSPSSASVGWNDTYIIHNDTTFAINITSTGGMNYFFMVSDFEYMRGADDYFDSAFSNYCPHGLFTAGMSSNMDLDDEGAYNINTTNPKYYYFISAYTPNYIAVDGAMRTPSKNMTTSYYTNSATGTYMQLNPACGSSVSDLPATGGGVVKPLVPVRMFNTVERGYSSHATVAMPFPKLMPNFYRTDDNGYSNGDVILDGTTKYRVMRVHKTGDLSASDDSKTIYTACYAFPEDNVAYG